METVVRGMKLAVALILVAVFGGCTQLQMAGRSGDAADNSAAAVATAVDQGKFDAEQLLVVIAEDERTSRAKLYVLERENNLWQARNSSIPAMIGRNGFAPPGLKREGDGRTPTGLFPLEYVFGYAPSVATRMPYRQASADDVWVDDANSVDYNQWKKRGETAATSFEEMRRADHFYRHGVVIGYNRAPVVKGYGSAIFLHIWREDGKATSGCVAIDEQQLVQIIGWLDPAKRPMILMGNRNDLATLPGLSGLAR